MRQQFKNVAIQITFLTSVYKSRGLVLEWDIFVLFCVLRYPTLALNPRNVVNKF